MTNDYESWDHNVNNVNDDVDDYNDNYNDDHGDNNYGNDKHNIKWWDYAIIFIILLCTYALH